MTIGTSEAVSVDEAAQAYARSCWRGFERCLFERMRDPDLPLLAEFARAFRINRQFPGRDGDAPNLVYQPVLDGLGAIPVPETQAELVSAVKKLSRTARSSGETLSAASKFIWARSPEIGVIYDSRARASLSLLRKETGVRRGRMTDYATFVEIWTAVFQLHKMELDRACREHGLTERWANRRLLDYWLYLNGPTPKGTKTKAAQI